MNTLKVGQEITLKSRTITPQIAVALRDAHFKIENYRLYEETK